MTAFMKDRQPIYQARKYDASAAYESSASSLAAWIESVTGMEVSAITADSQGFSFTYTSDSPYTKSGVPGDWIVLGAGDPEVMSDSNFERRYVVIV